MASKSKAKRPTWGQLTTAQRASARRLIRRMAAAGRATANNASFAKEYRAKTRARADALLAAVEKLMSPSD